MTSGGAVGHRALEGPELGQQTPCHQSRYHALQCSADAISPESPLHDHDHHQP